MGMCKVIFLFLPIILLFNCESNNLESPFFNGEVRIEKSTQKKIIKEIKSLKTLEEKEKYLLDISEQDQKIRQGQEDELKQKFGYKSKEVRDFVEKFVRTDAINFLKIKEYLKIHGYPDPAFFSTKASGTVVLIMLHQDYDKQLEISPIIWEAYRDGNLEASQLSFLLNRMHILKFGKSYEIEGAFTPENEIKQIMEALDLKND